jgi:hypothetical protein
MTAPRSGRRSGPRSRRLSTTVTVARQVPPWGASEPAGRRVPVRLERLVAS